MSDIKTINFKRSDFMAKEPTIVSKLLPILLVVSFCLVSLFSAITNVSSQFNFFIEYGVDTTYAIIFNVIFTALIQYLVYAIFLWIYKSILTTRPYFAFIGERKFTDTFGLWYVAKNVIYGLILFTQFWAPYLANLYSILNLVLSYLVVMMTYISLKNRVDIVFRPMILKDFYYPWFIWQGLGLLISILFGGILL